MFYIFFNCLQILKANKSFQAVINQEIPTVFEAKKGLTPHTVGMDITSEPIILNVKDKSKSKVNDAKLPILINRKYTVK